MRSIEPLTSMPIRVVLVGTVKVHLHNIFEKLDVAGRLELVLRARQKGLV